MSRSDQYIGLTKDAQEWLKTQKVVSTKRIELSEAAFGGNIYGNQYKIEAPYPDINEYYIVTETIQCAPWSSGPMYFTHLKIDLKKVADQEPVDLGFYFSWVANPSVEGEVDFERGHYYV